MQITRKGAIATLLLVLLFAVSTAPIYQAYARHTFAITASVGSVEGGTIDPSGVVQVNNCQNQGFTITPNSGYHVSTLTIDGVSNSVNIYGLATYTFIKVKADHTIVASFEENAAVSLPEGSNAVTEVNVLTTSPSLLPGFGEIPGIDGVTPYFDIFITEGSFSGIATVAIHYDDSGLGLEEEQNLRLYIGNPVDFNDDGSVNGNDVAAIQAAEKSELNVLGNLPDELKKFDLNNDGIIDIIDENIVKEYANSGIIVNPGQDDAGQFRIPWIDITTWVDVVNNIVYGETWHLSVFGIR